MSLFLSADYHFGHKNIIKYENRPFKTLDQMNDTIIRNHNSRVKKDDYFLHVGDFCFHCKSGTGNGSVYKASEFLERLNGIPVLLLGNHDKKGNSVNTKFQSLILQGAGFQIKAVHKPLHADPSYPLNLVGHVHSAWRTMNFKAYYRIQVKEAKRTDLPKHYIASVQQFVNRWRRHPKNSLLLNVGIDVHNFMPISYEEIMCIYYKWRQENAK